MCRIGGRLRSCHASGDGVGVEIPPFLYLGPNPWKEGDSVWRVV